MNAIQLKLSNDNAVNVSSVSKLSGPIITEYIEPIIIPTIVYTITEWCLVSKYLSPLTTLKIPASIPNPNAVLNQTHQNAVATGQHPQYATPNVAAQTQQPLADIPTAQPAPAETVTTPQVPTEKVINPNFKHEDIPEAIIPSLDFGDSTPVVEQAPTVTPEATPTPVVEQAPVVAPEATPTPIVEQAPVVAPVSDPTQPNT